MSGADEPHRTRRTLFNFETDEDMRQFALGSDNDIGGMSTVHLDRKGPGGTARFWGNLSLAVQPGMERKLQKSGYAGFRNLVRACALRCLPVLTASRSGGRRCSAT